MPTKQRYTDEFLQFWATYPQKKGRSEAKRWWLKYKPDLAEVMASLELQKQEKDWLASKNKFVAEWPYGSTYVHQKRWEDGLHPDFEEHLKWQQGKPEREQFAEEKRIQRIRDEYQDYLEGKSTRALLDFKKDGGCLVGLCDWLIDEILKQRDKL